MNCCRECVRLSEGLGIRAVVISNVTKARQKYGPQSSQKFGECHIRSIISCLNLEKLGQTKVYQSSLNMFEILKVYCSVVVSRCCSNMT